MRCNPSVLHEEAIQASSYSQDPYAGHLHLSFNLGRVSIFPPMGHDDPNWETFRPFMRILSVGDPLLLSFSLPEPLKGFVKQESMDVYSACFSALLRIRLSLSRLHASWQHLRNLDEGLWESAGSQRPLRMWHRQALQFTAALQQHIHGQLGSLWAFFQEEISARPRDVDQVAQMHSEYLCKVIIRLCFCPHDTTHTWTSTCVVMRVYLALAGC